MNISKTILILTSILSFALAAPFPVDVNGFCHLTDADLAELPNPMKKLSESLRGFRGCRFNIEFVIEHSDAPEFYKRDLSLYLAISGGEFEKFQRRLEELQLKSIERDQILTGCLSFALNFHKMDA